MNLKNFKPMLAGTVDDINSLHYPMWASPKLDGIRALIIDGVVYSRNLKPIPNLHVQGLFGKSKFNGFDGELLLNDESIPNTDIFRHTSSAVMSVEGKPAVRFHVFDSFTHGGLYYDDRLKHVQKILNHASVALIDVECTQVSSSEELINLESMFLEFGYEGVMLRSNHGCYKFGRSTSREGLLLKLKRFADGEAEVIGWEEQMKNTNEKTVDNLGNAKRSSHKANMQGKGTLGALIVRDVKSGVEFNIGTGMDDELRQKLWGKRNELIGKHVSAPNRLYAKYKYFPTGSKEKPRFPVFLGFRSAIDF